MEPDSGVVGYNNLGRGRKLPFSVSQLQIFDSKISIKRYQGHRQHFFSERVFGRWNGLDECVIDSTIVNSYNNG